MSYKSIVQQLWQQYSHEITAAKKIHQLLEAQGESVVNDHIALRTFNDTRVGIDVLAEPFVQEGYEAQGEYPFPVKKLFARHFEHPDPDAPKIFISELLVEEFDPWLQKFVCSLVDKIPQSVLQDPEKLLFCGTPWGDIRYQEYEKLLAQSQYAAWMYAFGFRANHFTVSLNHLKQFDTVVKINDFLKQNGFTLNAENGEVKGTPADMLEQSSIMAEIKALDFVEGRFEIPSCYYEFALRYPDKSGELYQGFVAASADKIFESTHNAKRSD